MAKCGEWIDTMDGNLRFVRNKTNDYIEVRVITKNDVLHLYLPVSKVEEALAQGFELDSLERAARYAGVTP